MKYDIKSLCKGENINFNLKSEDLLHFFECISYIKREIGYIAWGHEDSFLLFGEGMTTFYSSMAKTLDEAVKLLRAKLGNTKESKNVFLVFIVPDNKSHPVDINNIIEQLELTSSNIFFQVFLKNNSGVDMTPDGMLEYSSRFADHFTLYLFTNDDCKISHKDLCLAQVE